MKVRRAAPVAWMALALTIAAGTSAFAMQPVVNRDGLSAGGEVGYNFGNFNGNLSLAGDIDYGLKTHFLNQTYTGIVIDDLSVLGSGTKVSLTTIGIQQPFYSNGTTRAAGEVGFARGDVYVRGFGDSTSNGGFVGLRGTLAQSGDMSVNLMARYVFGGSSDTFWQVGVGLNKALSNGLIGQIDYYRVHPNTSGATDDNFILLGVRYNFSTGS